MQEDVAMIPMMMQKGYRAKWVIQAVTDESLVHCYPDSVCCRGWLGLILGQSLWYGFFPEAVPSEEKFMQTMDQLARAIGDRGKIAGAKVPEGVPPKSTAQSEPSTPVPKEPPQPTAGATAAADSEKRAASGPRRDHQDDFRADGLDLAAAPPPAALAPASAPTPAPPPAPALEPAPAPPRHIPSIAASHTPLAMHQHQVTNPLGNAAGHAVTSAGAFAEMATFFEQQQDKFLAPFKEQQQQSQADTAMLRTKLEEMQAQLEQQRAELSPHPPRSAITQSDLAALQARIGELHMTKLLSDDELYTLENLIADWVEVQASIVDQVVTEAMLFASAGLTFAAGAKVYSLLKLSTAMAGDAAFARQVRRKFIKAGVL
jgi:hypothetical protein